MNYDFPQGEYLTIKRCRPTEWFNRPDFPGHCEPVENGRGNPCFVFLSVLICEHLWLSGERFNKSSRDPSLPRSASRSKPQAAQDDNIPSICHCERSEAISAPCYSSSVKHDSHVGIKPFPANKYGYPIQILNHLRTEIAFPKGILHDRLLCKLQKVQ